ncbi:class I SAM-dependent methyltransferase [Thermaerobacillus caldiproteolyticus]|uniref:Site-specific DNA-methyltransferase (Adenine-specific) n=1 Tax=Thermaerobacillus caldiproteolyticus TaxID=247480 RepID=A0A7V9Z4B1_9BACL|nr:class I SAM-dependent methyltransferase [Anoxybacillus caldiproteolyticus]MBA2873813.1 site-specific DNA-methyltransferase (adenine-specific) [Anoxybacillus caldiproteolyticus]
MTTPVERLFTLFDETATILQEELQCTYLEAVAETGENVFHGDVLQEEVSELNAKRLKKEYKEIQLDRFTNEEIRKAFQLAVLKGMKEHTQPHHQMTPDAVGLFMSYIVSKFTGKYLALTILDPAVGTANLLTTVLNHLPGKQVKSYGADVDDLLIRLAYVNANLQKQPIQLFNQDSLQPLFVELADVVICDLPVGYYPNDANASRFVLKAENGHSYAHHLFIEQSLYYTKEGGYLFFLIPNSLFSSDQSAQLHTFLKEQAVIQGLLQLPMSMFKNEQAAKSIFILQKKGANVKAPKKALLAELPRFSNKQAMQVMMRKIDEWFATEKHE